MQALYSVSLAIGLLVLFVPKWFTYEQAEMGLDRILLENWVGIQGVTVGTCLQRFSSLVCYSLGRFYMAGLIVMATQFKVFWVLSLATDVHNICNLYATLNYKHWKFCKFEVNYSQFLHLLAPVLFFTAFLLWFIVAQVYALQRFRFEFGCWVAIGLGLVHCALGVYYYHFKLVEDGQTHWNTSLYLPNLIYTFSYMNFNYSQIDFPSNFRISSFSQL